MDIFPSISLESPYHQKCVLKPQNRAHFSEAIDLKGHIPRFTQKMNVFPSISLEPHKYVLKPSEQGSFFWDDQFEGSHA